jgi:hypothetical protein
MPAAESSRMVLSLPAGDVLPALGEHLEALPRDPHRVLDRLVDVRARRHHDRLGLPRQRGELLAQQGRGFGLGDQLRLEVQPAAEPEVLVVLPRKAVHAPVLAPAVGVQRPVEGDVARPRDVVDDPLRAVAEDPPLHPAQRAVLPCPLHHLPVQLLAQDVQADGLEAVAGVEPGPAAVGGTAGERIAVRIVLRDHTIHTTNISRAVKPPSRIPQSPGPRTLRIPPRPPPPPGGGGPSGLRRRRTRGAREGVRNPAPSDAEGLRRPRGPRSRPTTCASCRRASPATSSSPSCAGPS